MNRPPWLKTRSTGADVHGVQKILSNSGFKQANCLLFLTSCHGMPTSVPSSISCTYARYELTRLGSGRVFSADGAGLRYDANSEVLGILARGGHDLSSPASPSLLVAAAAGVSPTLTSRAAARIHSTSQMPLL